MSTRTPQPQPFNHMHQELSLWAAVSAARQPQLLRIVGGLAGMAPEPFLQHHLVYKPARGKPTHGSAELFYLQLVARVPAAPPDRDRDPDAMEDAPPPLYEPRAQRWTLRLEDLPEVTRKPVVSRHIYAAETGDGDVVAFVGALGYVLQAPYFTENVRVVHGNVLLTFSRVLTPPPPPANPANPADPAAAAAAAAANDDAALGSPWPREHLRHVDPAHGWILQAAVRVASQNDVESIAAGVAELAALREMLKGVCELQVVERLALDTRVR